MGCSTQSVPSRSSVATRCSGGTSIALDRSVVARTNSTSAFFGAPSFQDGSGSPLFSSLTVCPVSSRNERTAPPDRTCQQRFNTRTSSLHPPLHPLGQVAQVVAA